MARIDTIVEWDYRVSNPDGAGGKLYGMYCTYCKVGEVYIIWDKEYPKKEEYYKEAKNMGAAHAAEKHWDEYMRAYA